MPHPIPFMSHYPNSMVLWAYMGYSVKSRGFRVPPCQVHSNKISYLDGARRLYSIVDKRITTRSKKKGGEKPSCSPAESTR